MSNSLHSEKRILPSTTLRDILTPGVIGVSTGSSMDKALTIMREARISSVVALNRSRPVGILTERGVISALAAHGRDLLRRKVREIMSSPVLTAPEDMPIHQAFATLIEKGIRHLVVVDAKGKALGMVTQTNMVQNLGLEYFVEIKRTGQIMAREVAVLKAEDSLETVLKLLVGGPYSCVVAMEKGKPAGIITERDMVALVAEGRDLAATPMGAVMSWPVFTIAQDAPVHQAASFMREKNIRRLVVADSSGIAVGLLTQSDIVKGMEARYVEMLKEVIREKDQLLREAVNEAAKKSIYLDTILNTTVDTGIAATDGETIAFVNQAARDILPGCDEAIGKSLMDFHKLLGVSPSRLKRVMAHIRMGNRHRFSAEVEKDGVRRYIDGRISAIWGGGAKPSGYVFMFRDVTERRQAEMTITHMAYHDALTGLPNRFLVADRLEQGLAQARRRGYLLAVMLLDLDGFKTVNDTLGHNVGDLLLKEVASRLPGLLRKSDTIGRMGGDEFLIVLPEVKTPEGVASVAAKMLKAVQETRNISNHDITVSTSIGLALYPWDGADAQSLIQKADQAMYMAKEAGRNTYRFASESRDGLAFNHP
jgi:diguanylate cyclase (GGDEF)-like protein/PAS domain S-box-containing protein